MTKQSLKAWGRMMLNWVSTIMCASELEENKFLVQFNKDDFLYPLHFFPFFIKINLSYVWGSDSRYSILLHCSKTPFLFIPCCIHYYHFVQKVWSCGRWCSLTIFFLSIVVDIGHCNCSLWISGVSGLFLWKCHMRL